MDYDKSIKKAIWIIMTGILLILGIMALDAHAATKGRNIEYKTPTGLVKTLSNSRLYIDINDTNNQHIYAGDRVINRNGDNDNTLHPDSEYAQGTVVWMNTSYLYGWYVENDSKDGYYTITNHNTRPDGSRAAIWTLMKAI